MLQQTMYDSGRFIQMVLRVLQDGRDTIAGLAFVLAPGLDLTSQAPALYLHLACFRESPAACARPGRSMRPPAESGMAVWVRSQYDRRLSARKVLSRCLLVLMKQTLPCVGFRTEHGQSTLRVQSKYTQNTFRTCDLQQFCAIAIPKD